MWIYLRSAARRPSKAIWKALRAVSSGSSSAVARRRWDHKVHKIRPERGMAVLVVGPVEPVGVFNFHMVTD